MPPKRPRPNPELVALLRALTREAELGNIQEVFAWFRGHDGTADYQLLADDVPDMLFEIGSALILERSAGPKVGGSA